MFALLCSYVMNVFLFQEDQTEVMKRNAVDSLPSLLDVRLTQVFVDN